LQAPANVKGHENAAALREDSIVHNLIRKLSV